MPVAPIDFRDAQSVCEALRAGARANATAACRVLGIDRIRHPGLLIATGDLHDNPFHFDALCRVAQLEERDDTHLVFHEVIHSDRLMNGMDLSYRALTKVAGLKAAYPERIHTLLANHELAQYQEAAILKDGVQPVLAFKKGLEYVFGGEMDEVLIAIKEFIASMPIALRCVCPNSDFIVCHSLPAVAMMGRFDPSIFSRALTDDDFRARAGSVHHLVWGRGYDSESIEDLVERWGASMFLLGHEHADSGARFVPPCAVVLNSDHERGVYVPIDLSNPPRAEQVPEMAIPLNSV